MSTYTPIASQTLTASVASITFAGIPQHYQDLVIVTNVKSTSTGNMIMRFNNDSTSGLYGETRLSANGSSVTVDRLSAYNEIYTEQNGYFDGTNFNQVKIINIMNYSNNQYYKTCLIRSNRAQTGADAIAASWANTNAITSVFLSANGLNFVAGSTFNLYGISAGSPKAQGGSVTTDGTYWYHTFRDSGLFTVNQALTADYLVVAGGGAGGGANGHAGSGGGGAGGLRCTVTASGGTPGTVESALSLIAGNYTVTVGAGGAGGGGQTYGGNGSNSVFSTITSIGGGGGAANTGTRIGSVGGSGGGGSNNETTGQAGGAGTANQGFAGGSSGNSGSSGGGGGAGSVGGNGSTGTAGSGGSGRTVAITGTSVAYAGGGGGGGNTRGTGTDGGGNGETTNSTAGSNGSASTGSGGGGRSSSSMMVGYSGGSGIVVVRYAV